MLGFSIILVLLIVTTLGSVRDDYQKFIGENEVLQVCALLKSGVEKIYVPGDHLEQTNATMGSLTVDLPLRIADIPYRARFVNASVAVETLSPRLNDTCKLGFNVTYSGFTSGGRTKLEWTRYSGNRDEIRMGRP